MIGRLKILNLKAHCIVGKTGKERWEEQPVGLDIEIDVDFEKCYGMNNTSRTVD